MPLRHGLDLDLLQGTAQQTRERPPGGQDGLLPVVPGSQKQGPVRRAAKDEAGAEQLSHLRPADFVHGGVLVLPDDRQDEQAASFRNAWRLAENAGHSSRLIKTALAPAK